MEGNTDDFLCNLTCGDAKVLLRIRAEVTDEPYRAHTLRREFVPLTVTAGIRTRVIAQAYAQEIGGVVQRMGEAEAYYYQDDAVLLLWRCRLIEPLRKADPVSDTNLHVLWESFERFLAARFPANRATITPAWNRPYRSDHWTAFLAAHKFTRPSPAGIPGMAFIRPRSLGHSCGTGA